MKTSNFGFRISHLAAVVFQTALCFLWLTCPQVQAAVAVDINLNAEHSVGGVSTFDRSTYMVLHAGLRDNDWDSDAQRAQFLNDYDAYLGRNNGTLPWNLSQTSEHPTRPGWPSSDSLESLGDDARGDYADDTAVHPFESRSANMMIGGQMVMYPNGQTNGNGWALADYDALADYFAQFLTNFYGRGGTSGEPKPAMVEVVNEPFVQASKYGTTRANISQMHNVVATRVKDAHPDVLVGGYTSAHPAFEANNSSFSHWHKNWKLFIDTAGTNMDFFSVHLYDNPAEDNPDPALTTYRSGSNVEAILDMIEHYSFLTLGEVKPFNISEYGSLSVYEDAPYTREADWASLRSFSTILMQLLERPDRMLQAIPFMILKAEWGRRDSGNPYPSRLLRQAFEVPPETGDHWVYTELVKFWQLWSEVKGTRVDTVSSDPDLQVDAYVDGTNAYVIVSSLDHLAPQTVDLNLSGLESNVPLSVEVKHVYADGTGLSVLDVYTTGGLSQVTLEKSSTAVLKYTFAEPVAIGESSTEATYYADTYLQPISGDAPSLFNIHGVSNITAYGEVVLRLGVGREHGESLQPAVQFNGANIDVPADWRGYDQATRDRFFGVLEIPVPHSLLRSNNTVRVQFPNSGGHISSLALQVFSFSSDLRDFASTLPFLSAQQAGSNIILNVTNGPPNGFFSVLSTGDLPGPTWTTNATSLPYDGTGSATVSQPMSDPRRFYRVAGSGPPPVPVTGLDVFPADDVVAVGGTCRPLARVSPAEASDPSVNWDSSNPSVALVSSDGRVSGVAHGSAVITATTTDGGFTDTCTMTVGSSSPGIDFDDWDNYRNRSFQSGTSLEVKCTYDAGPGHTVTSGQGGIKYRLREIENDTTWHVENDYLAYDANPVGVQSGGSSATISLVGVPPTSDLPTGSFYFLFLNFSTSDGSSHNVGLRPVIITDR